MGEFLQKALSPSFMSVLRTQNLSVNDRDIVGPKVTFEFGPVKLHAAASSSDLALAQAFGIDRLALALTEARVKHKPIEALMKDHFLEVLRNV